MSASLLRNWLKSSQNSVSRLKGTMQSVVQRNATLKKAEGEILFISDLEGCATYSPLGENQSSVMCSKEFFNALDDFMKNNSSNKIAFLGDYFDKGPHLESIGSIVFLYEKYNKEGKPKRVYILLGNRDINKLRIPYEVQQKIISSERFNEGKQLRWKDWDNVTKNGNTTKGFYSLISEASSNKSSKEEVSIGYQHPNGHTPLNLNNIPIQQKYIDKILKIILEKSMDAMHNPGIVSGNTNEQKTQKISNNKNKTFNSKNKTFNSLKKILKRNDNTKNNNNKITKLGNVKFNENTGVVNFREKVTKLFEYGKLIEYDVDFQVLMSHAGGMDESVLFAGNIYSSICNELNEKIDSLDYFSRIEFCRRKLMEKSGRKNLSNIKLFKATNSSSMYGIEYLCEEINNVFNAVREKTETFTSFNHNTLCPEYYLLQAMALKPDSDKEIEKHFASVIHAGDAPSGCKGPKSSSPEYSAFLSKINSMGVKFISCGHIPQCVPLPLIYVRETFKESFNRSFTKNNTMELDPIVFIQNNTSNGYRPKNLNKVWKVPISFIQRKGTLQEPKLIAGVGLFDENKYDILKRSYGLFYHAPDRTFARRKESVKTLGKFQALLNTWETDTEYPTFIETGAMKAILYKNVKKQTKAATVTSSAKVETVNEKLVFSKELSKAPIL